MVKEFINLVYIIINIEKEYQTSDFMDELRKNY